jgi:ribosome-associated heat shock protein Hsp15
MKNDSQIRLDKWVWAVRMYKTRSLAKTECDSGKVTVNGTTSKPSKLIRVGDMIETKRPRYHKKYKVLKLIPKRVSAALAAVCFEDHSPEQPKKDAFVVLPVAMRERGSGRPTKKESRETQRLKNFWDE